MSAFGYDRLIGPLYKYRPGSVRALAALASADSRDNAARTYFADLLRIVALGQLKPGTDLPRLEDVISKQHQTDDSADELRKKLLAKLKE